MVSTGFVAFLLVLVAVITALVTVFIMMSLPCKLKAGNYEKNEDGRITLRTCKVDQFAAGISCQRLDRGSKIGDYVLCANKDTVEGDNCVPST